MNRIIAPLVAICAAAFANAEEPAFYYHAKSNRVHLHAEADDATMTQIPDSAKILFMLSKTKVTSKGMQRFKSLQKLEFVRLNHLEDTDAALAALAEHSTLRSLMLWNDSGITATGVAHLGSIESLTRLDFTSSPLNASALQAMPPQITSLKLQACNVGDAGLKSLPTFKKLTGVALQGDNKITDAGLVAFIERHPQLESLATDIVSDRLLDSLAKLPALKTLYFSGPEISASQIHKIGDLHALERVNISAKLNGELRTCIQRLPNQKFKYVVNQGKYIYLNKQ